MTYLQEILKLSTSERVLLVEAIWDSIVSESNTNKADLNPQTKTMLDERLKTHLKNPTTGSSWQEVKDRVSKDL